MLPDRSDRSDTSDTSDISDKSDTSRQTLITLSLCQCREYINVNIIVATKSGAAQQ